MAFVHAKLVGGFVRWLSKKCKTKLGDEVNGRLDAKWGSSYDAENYIIGLVTIGVILIIVISLFF